jgi:hypothetical protein
MKLFSTFPKFVNDELERRRNSRDFFQDTKSPWMRMTSNFRPGTVPEAQTGGAAVAQGSDERFLAGRRVLMGGDLGIDQELTFGFANIYENQTASGERFRPQPGIESIEVEEQLESFECTVNWFANSIGQLDRLFPYFMNLGTTVIVDWGWDNVPPSAPIDVSNENEVRSYYQQLGVFQDEPAIQTAEGSTPNILSRYQSPKYKKLREGQGRYCFVAGTVTDFSYTPEGNSQYSCTTELTSISKAMSKLRNRKQEQKRIQKGETVQGIQQGKKEKLDHYTYMQQNFQDDLEDFANEDDNKDVVKIKQDAENTSRRSDAYEANTYYVSWKRIEEIVNDYAPFESGEAKVDGESIKNFQFNSASSIISSFNAGETVTVNGRESPVNLRTLDPLICIVDVGGQYDKFRNLSDRDYEPVSTQLADDFNLDASRQGLLYNLYIEYQLVLDAFEKNETILKAMQHMLNRASKACFDIWDFDIKIDTGIYRVVDNNMTSGPTVESRLSADESFEFQPNTRLSILRDFSFDTNMADLMKSQIIAQRNAKREGTSKNAAINSRNDANARFFKGGMPGKDLVLGNLQKPKSSKSSKEQKQKESRKDPAFEMPPNLPSAIGAEDWIPFNEVEYEDIRKGARQNVVQGSSESTRFVVYQVDQSSGAALARYFSQLLQADESELSGINGNNTLNIDAQLTLDGIGGFCAFQTMKIVNIPRVFETNGIFTIDSVTHSVSTDDWTTELKTSFVLRNGFSQEEDGGDDLSGVTVSQERFDRIRSSEQEEQDNSLF